MPLVFAYGTLMRGECRHQALTDEEFVGVATTMPHYRLYDCGSYPGLVHVEAGNEIEGEVWRVSRSSLERLDQIEGVDEGLYARGDIALKLSPTSDPVEAYFYLPDITGLVDLGVRWR